MVRQNTLWCMYSFEVWHTYSYLLILFIWFSLTGVAFIHFILQEIQKYLHDFLVDRNSGTSLLELLSSDAFVTHMHVIASRPRILVLSMKNFWLILVMVDTSRLVGRAPTRDMTMKSTAISNCVTLKIMFLLMHQQLWK